jgi:beta-galactosidase
VARFQHDQVEILRGANPKWWVTHNGIMQHTDYRGLFTKDLDVLGWDAYPMFIGDPTARPAGHALSCDRVRALSGNYIVPEHQSGFGGQPNYMLDTPEPGEMRQLTLVTVARGADSLLYFRWRTCRFGAEEYWGGIIDHDNVPRRRYAELAQIGREIAALGPAVLGTSVHIDCAVASGDQDVVDAHTTYHLGLPHDGITTADAHAPLLNAGYAIGCVHPADDLSGVKLYIIPQWALFDPAWVPNLERFVAGGGTLVIGARSASRDLDNNVVAATLPGCLRPLAGATVEEYGRQNQPDKHPLELVLPDGKGGETAVRSEWFYEALAADAGTSVHARWRGRHLDGQPAITMRPHGRGRTIYVGTYFTQPLVRALLPWLADLTQLAPLWPSAPAGVQVVRREGRGKTLWFFSNHTDGPVTIASTPAGTDLLSGKAAGGALTLGRYGVAAIRV